MVETILDELKRYVGFGPADEGELRALDAVGQTEYQRISEVFYERILAHEGARKALEGGESQVGHLKHTLVEWMGQLFGGPWDEPYFEMRERIGRKHVAIALPQHYMFGAMNILRQELNGVVDRTYWQDPERLRAARVAVGKILDLELAVMLHTYREDLLSQQARAERLSTFGQLIGSIGHELRNPLGVMESSLYIVKGRVVDDERAQKHLDRIGEQIGIANAIIKDLLDMIRDRPLATSRLCLLDVLQSAANQLHLAVSLEAIADLPEVEGDASQLRQVFVNLLDNATHAAGPEGWIRVEGAVEDGVIARAVEDSGKGVDESIRRRLFEPLVTTKQKGIGLGLALVKRIVERHRGTIAHEPRDHGARFVVRLPRA